MAITVIKGPIDALSEGILAGTKMAAVRARLQFQKDVNKHRDDELAIAKTRAETADKLADSTVRSQGAQNDLARARADVITQTLPAQVLAGKTKATQEQMDLLSSRLATSYDPDPTIAESRARVGTPNFRAMLEEQGVELTPTNLEFWAQADFGQKTREANELDIELKKAESQIATRDILTGIALQREGRAVDPATAAMIAIDKDRIMKLNENKMLLDVISEMRRQFGEGGKEGEAPAPKDLEKEIEEAMRILQGRVKSGGGAAAPRPGAGAAAGRQLGTHPDSGLPVVTNDADYGLIKSGTRFFYSVDGTIREKP